MTLIDLGSYLGVLAMVINRESTRPCLQSFISRETGAIYIRCTISFDYAVMHRFRLTTLRTFCLSDILFSVVQP
jgi:hypothetical protein